MATPGNHMLSPWQQSLGIGMLESLLSEGREKMDNIQHRILRYHTSKQHFINSLI